MLDQEFIKAVEASHFRTDQDTGANHNALLIWNMVRNHIGLPSLALGDLPTWCVSHKKYHIFRPDHGCERQIP